MNHYTLSIHNDDIHIEDEVDAKDIHRAVMKFLLRHPLELSGFDDYYVYNHVREESVG